MSKIINFSLAAHVELQDILSKSESFYEVYDSVRNSRGILGRMADDIKGDSSFWADIAELYDGRAKFSTELIYVLNIQTNGINNYIHIDHGYMRKSLVNELDMATRFSIESINDMNPRLIKFAVPVDQEVNHSVCGED